MIYCNYTINKSGQAGKCDAIANRYFLCPDFFENPVTTAVCEHHYEILHGSYAESPPSDLLSLYKEISREEFLVAQVMNS
jgi:hypothetical protein